MAGLGFPKKMGLTPNLKLFLLHYTITQQKKKKKKKKKKRGKKKKLRKLNLKFKTLKVNLALNSLNRKKIFERYMKFFTWNPYPNIPLRMKMSQSIKIGFLKSSPQE